MDLRKYPKVELHRHLEGALRLSTLLELAKKSPKDVDELLIRTPMRDLKTVLDKFSATQALLNSKEILTRIAFEAVEDAVGEGIKILELRYSPTFIQSRHSHLSFAEIHSAVLAGIKMAKHLPIAVGLICIFQRTLPNAESLKVLNFIKDTQETWIGVDLADDEQNFPAKSFQHIFAETRKMGLPATVHAGEVLDQQAAQNVIDAIEELGAIRIGHGLQIHNNPEAIELVKARKVPLELCPTSNWITNAITKIQDHPFNKLRGLGVLCTINSDDPGIFGIDLVNEYEVLQKQFQFSQQDFDQCNDIAAAASFIPKEKKQQHWPRQIREN